MTQLPAIFSEARQRLFLRLIVNGALQAAAIVGSMLLVRHAFNVLLNPEFDDAEVHMFDFSEVWAVGLFALGLMGCTGFAAWLRFTERIDAERLGQAYIHQVRLTVFDTMSHFSPRALSDRSTGSSMLRFVGDLSAIRRWVSLGLARIVVSLIVTIISISVLAHLDPYLALCSIAILSLGLIWNLKMGPHMHKVIIEARRRRGHLAGNINEKIRSYIVIQAFNQRRRERRRFHKQSQRLSDAMIERAGASAGMRVVNEGATALSMAGILSLGALQVFRGMTSSGNVVAAMAVVGFLSTAFRDLGRVHEYLQAYKVSKKKILEFMETRQLRGRSSKLPALQVSKGEIEVQRVRIRGILRNLSGTIQGGTRLALLGDNGAGKSTLLQVIARLVDPERGKVLIDGQDIRRCSLDSVREAIGIVSPDLPLLKGSIRYNLLYRKPDASAEEIERVKRLCKVDDLLSQLPGGEKFRIKEGGENLSLGQRHKLALARALLGQPSILIVDEIDANLDQLAVNVFAEVIRDFQGTVLMVSRFSDRLALADEYWCLAGGKLESTVKNKRKGEILPCLGLTPWVNDEELNSQAVELNANPKASSTGAPHE
jgi:ABC-type multidrug transport system fused ATPase/permease subunit